MKFSLALALPFFTGANAFAESRQFVGENLHPSTLPGALGYTALFGLLGLILLIAGFKIFDKVITRIDLEEEVKRGNLAAAILSAGVVIGLALIIAASMS